MNGRNAVIALASVMAIAALGLWWFQTFERVEEDVAAPLHGEALYNPLYALKKVLQVRGIDVGTRANLNLQAMALGSKDTLVLDADVRTLTHDQVSDLLDWIDDGGQLVFPLPQGSEGRGGELLDAFGLTVGSHLSCLSWPIEGSVEKAEHCFHFDFSPKEAEVDAFDVLVSAHNDKGYVMGRRTRGDGAWFVAGDLDFLRNRELDTDGNSALAWQVLAPALRGGRVNLVYAADVPPLYVLLVKRGWPVLLPTLLALFAWLWARSQRFGPLLPLAAAHRRALREHVQAAGEFTFRRGRTTALYAPLRRAFDEQLRRDDPAIAALDGDALITALATRHQNPLAEVRQALNPVNLGQPEHFFATIKTLTELRIRK
ncbi:MAG: DUF4350 domain-containing protein [Dokdonella sp.]